MITINDDAKKYIKEKGNILQIIVFNRMSVCCGRINLGPHLSLSKPKDIENYTLEHINEVDVYIPKDFHSPNPLSIELQKLFGFKNLQIIGWKLI